MYFKFRRASVARCNATLTPFYLANSKRASRIEITASFWSIILFELRFQSEVIRKQLFTLRWDSEARRSSRPIRSLEWCHRYRSCVIFICTVFPDRILLIVRLKSIFNYRWADFYHRLTQKIFTLFIWSTVLVNLRAKQRDYEQTSLGSLSISSGIRWHWMISLIKLDWLFQL